MQKINKYFWFILLSVFFVVKKTLAQVTSSLFFPMITAGIPLVEEPPIAEKILFHSSYPTIASALSLIATIFFIRRLIKKTGNKKINITFLILSLIIILFTVFLYFILSRPLLT